MSNSHLKINISKFEPLTFSLELNPISLLKLREWKLFFPLLRSPNLGSFLPLSYIQFIYKFCWFYFQNISRIWPLLTTYTTPQTGPSHHHLLPRLLQQPSWVVCSCSTVLFSTKSNQCGPIRSAIISHHFSRKDPLAASHPRVKPKSLWWLMRPRLLLTYLLTSLSLTVS